MTEKHKSLSIGEIFHAKKDDIYLSDEILEQMNYELANFGSGCMRLHNKESKQLVDNPNDFALTIRKVPLKLFVRMRYDALWDPTAQIQKTLLKDVMWELGDAIDKIALYEGSDAISNSCRRISVEGTDYFESGETFLEKFEEAKKELVSKKTDANGFLLDVAFKYYDIEDMNGFCSILEICDDQYPDNGIHIEGLEKKEDGTGEDIAAIIGDFKRAFKASIQNVKVRLLQYGDPDGKGDLAGHNEIALCLYVDVFIGTNPNGFIVLTN